MQYGTLEERNERRKLLCHEREMLADDIAEAELSLRKLQRKMKATLYELNLLDGIEHLQMGEGYDSIL